MLNYYMPVRLITGKDSVLKNGKLISQYGSKCIIVTGRSSAKKCGALDDCIRILSENKIEYTIFDEIKPNPTVASCMEAGKKAHAFGAEFVLGIGGGSPLDAAKAVAIFAANPDMDETKFYSKVWEHSPLPIVLIGTTSGTGSEVTKVSVLTDSAGKKHSIHLDSIYAALAFGDAEYTMSTPKDISLSTGIDILAHCTEAYFSHKADEISRSYSIRGISLLFAPMMKLCNDEPLDYSDREKLYEASILGGLAIATTGTCFPHNVGYYFTENHNIPHGFACAQFYNDMLDIEMIREPEITQGFFSALNLSVEELKNLVNKSVPANDIRLSEELIEEILPRWENNGSVLNTLGNVTTKDIREILKKKFC